MKGVVKRLHIIVDNESVLPGVPLPRASLRDGLAELVAGLNVDASSFHAEITFDRAHGPDVRLAIGDRHQGLRLAADGWRALIGYFASYADWNAPTPYGAALAAAIGTAETYKQLVRANGGCTTAMQLIENLAYSTYNYGVEAAAQEGPRLSSLHIDAAAVAGCGAGGRQRSTSSLCSQA